MPVNADKTAIVIGVGPGLGLSIARRFGREGYRVALVSRSGDRLAEYVADLAGEGIEAAAFAADATEPKQLRDALAAASARFGDFDAVYFGVAGADPDFAPVPITEINADLVRRAFEWVYPAVEAVSAVLPSMMERRVGGILLAGGISGKLPMPQLGQLALASAALRNYALTLNPALAEHGVYAGTLTIGGLVERGDIYKMIESQPEKYGDIGAHTLNPDEIADAAWDMFVTRDRAESVFNAMA